MQSMSEAKNLHDQNIEKGPAVYSDTYPIVQELSAESLPVSAPAGAIQYEVGSEKRSALTKFSEHFAAFVLKFLLISATAFAAGAFITINVLMDRIDHKSGWLKEFLQFIKETSKYFLK